MKDWKVYLIQCSDNTFYCGSTNRAIEDRIEIHNKGKGSKYTRCRLPVSLIFCSKDMSKSDAYKLEYKVKQQPRNHKLSYLKNY